MRRAALLGLIGGLVSGAARAGETRCWVDHGAVVVAAAFGDIVGDFIVDASTPNSRLHITRAQGDGIDATTVRRQLVVADEKIADFKMDVADLDLKTRVFDTSINGVIGLDLLRRYVVDISFSPCRMRLSHGMLMPIGGAVRIPLREIGGVATVRATISDGLQTRADDFAIDTSQPVSRIVGAALSRPAAPKSNPPTRIRALAVADQLFEQTSAEVSTTQNAIGTAVWAKGRLRMNVKAGWAEFTPARP